MTAPPTNAKERQEWEVEKLLPSKDVESQLPDGDISTDETENTEKADVEPSPTQTRRNVIVAVAFYWVVSLSLVFLNKYAMSDDPDLMDVPLFFVWTQLIFAILICGVLAQLGQAYEAFSWFPAFEYNIAKAKKVLPLSFIFVGMLVFNNLCLKYVNVSFYQVARSLTIIFNIVFTGTILGKWPSKNAIGCCLIILVGYVIGSGAEFNIGTVGYSGIAYGILASVFVSLYAIYVKKILPVVDKSSEKLIMYNNINSAFILLLVSFLVEDIHFTKEALLDRNFWFVICGAGFLGFLINYASFIQIKFTSPLTHNVSGTAKACCQTIIAILFIGNPWDRNTLFGFAMVIGGSAAYSYVKHREMRKDDT